MQEKRRKIVAWNEPTVRTIQEHEWGFYVTIISFRFRRRNGMNTSFGLGQRDP